LLRDLADFPLHGLSVFVAILQLLGDLWWNTALRRLAFDKFDHLDLGLAEISDQLAGFIRSSMSVTGGLD